MYVSIKVKNYFKHYVLYLFTCMKLIMLSCGCTSLIFFSAYENLNVKIYGIEAFNKFKNCF